MRYYSRFMLPDEQGNIQSSSGVFDYGKGGPIPFSNTFASAADTNINIGDPLSFNRWHAIVSAPLVDEVTDFLANSYVKLEIDHQSFEAPLLHLVRETLPLPVKQRTHLTGSRVYFPNLRANARLLDYLRAPYGSILTLANHHGIPIPEDLAARDAAARLGGIEPSLFYGWIIVEGDYR